MKLATFLKRQNISRAEFARTVGVDPISVWRWENDKCFPFRHLSKIVAATDGKVTANDFAAAEKVG